MSSHVAMSMLMALFPFILFVVALASMLASNVNVDDLIELVFGSWPDAIEQPITNEVRAVLSNSSTNLITIGGVLTLFFASNGVNAVREAMTGAYRGDDPRPFWKQRLLCVIFVLVGAVGVLVAAVFGLAIPLYVQFIRDNAPDVVVGWFPGEGLRSTIAAALLITGVTACHLILPGYRRPAAHIWPGIALTVVLWAVATKGFSIYMARFASYNATYAGLAGVMSALFFLYLMSAILILGAEFNGAIGELDADLDDPMAKE